MSGDANRQLLRGRARDVLAEVKAQRDRLAQALWLLRDTTSEGSYAHTVVTRALEEARIDEPEEPSRG